ncbi:DUF4229 domain-containing protein [Cellulomonas hominis]
MPVVKYSVLRLGLFVLCLVLLMWAGMGSWLAVVVAAFGAWGLSYVLLAGPRDGAAIWLAERAAARGDRPRLSRHAQEDAEAEDAAVDAVDAELVTADDVATDPVTAGAADADVATADDADADLMTVGDADADTANTEVEDASATGDAAPDPDGTARAS